MLGLYRGEGGPERVSVANVACDGRARGRHGAEQLHHLVEHCLAPRHADHHRAAAREIERETTSDARRGARHDRDVTVEAAQL